MFPMLFSPITINKLEIKNRIAYPSLGLCYSYDGSLNERYYNYFREKARGGAGIVTVGPVGIDRCGAGMIVLSLAEDRFIPHFKKLASMIRDEGARAWIQLFHAGAYAFSALLAGERPIAPTAVYSRYSKETPREMTLEDIRNTQDAFVAAALRAREAGFDGIEIIASAGYLITQFLSPVKNRRGDEYGGSFENRTRFPREVLEMLRRSLGGDFPITVRMAGNDFVSGSNTDRETPEIARVYESAGADMINVTGGWHETRVPQLPMELPRGAYGYLALNIKKAVSVPVMASNRISDPGVAERILSHGMADMVNLGRVLIADPEWPKKAKEGRALEIRPCVACNQGCTDTIFSGRPVFCIVNPRAGFEAERNVQGTRRPMDVMVVGAGPGGLKAAITATQAGHRVEIYERNAEIGGQIKLAGSPLHKKEILEILRYYRVMIDKLGIPVHLGVEVAVEDVAAKKPDYVIIAEGALPLVPPIDGVEGKSVYISWDVLKGAPVPGGNIAVIGGGAVGLEVALTLAARGTIDAETVHFLLAHDAADAGRVKELMFRGSSRVTVFEMLPAAGKDVGKSTRWILKKNLERYGVEVITGARVLSVRDGVTFERDGRKESRQFDSVVMSVGSRPVKTLSEGMRRTGIPFAVIGDCVRPAKLNDAIHEGYLAALEIDRALVGATG